MGANLCCMKDSEEHTKEVISCDQNVMEGNKQESAKKGNSNPSDGKIATKGFSTLGQCLLDSPILNPPCSIGGEIQAIKLYNEVQMSSPEVHTSFYTPRMSFSVDRLGLLGKIEEEDDEEELSVGSISRTQSGKLKKRVSFKLPEAADIFVFYSPEETLKE